MTWRIEDINWKIYSTMKYKSDLFLKRSYYLHAWTRYSYERAYRHCTSEEKSIVKVTDPFEHGGTDINVFLLFKLVGPISMHLWPNIYYKVWVQVRSLYTVKNIYVS